MYALDTDNEAAESFAQFEWRIIEHLEEKEAGGEVDDENNPLPPEDNPSE
jgi:hypothetical protein